MRWFCFKMSGFRGMWVSEQVLPLRGLYWIDIGCAPNSRCWMVRTDRDGFLCESEEACEMWCDYLNRNANRGG